MFRSDDKSKGGLVVSREGRVWVKGVLVEFLKVVGSTNAFLPPGVGGKR